MNFIIGALAVFACMHSASFADTTRQPNAGCVVLNNKGEVLLVRDVWSKKLSLPGGGPETAETPEQTAQRELFEETGIHSETLQSLNDPGPSKLFFRAFYCALSQSEYERAENLSRSKLPYPPSKNEIFGAQFYNLKTLELKELRFQSQLTSLQNWVEQAQQLQSQQAPLTELPQVEVRQAPHALQRFSIRLSERLQSFPQLLPVMKGFTFLGEEEFLYAFIPVIWAFVSRSLGIELVFLILISTLINAHAKGFLEATRPFHWSPHIKLGDANGYGIPSGHAQLTFAYFGYLLMHLRKHPQFRRIAFVLIVLGLGTALSRIYLGVHFVYDVWGGWTLGALSIFIFIWMKNFFRTETSRVVAGIILSATAILTRPHPETVVIVATTLGIYLGYTLGALRPQVSRTSNRSQTKLLGECFLFFGGLLVISRIFQIAMPVDLPFLTCLLLRVARYLSIGIWIGLLHRITAQKQRSSLR